MHLHTNRALPLHPSPLPSPDHAIGVLCPRRASGTVSHLRMPHASRGSQHSLYVFCEACTKALCT